MRKQDLKTGMLVVQRDGDKKIVFLDSCTGHSHIVDLQGFHGKLDDYNDDLTNRYVSQNDIVAVYGSNYATKIVSTNPDDRHLLWEREYPSVDSRYISAQEYEEMYEYATKNNDAPNTGAVINFCKNKCNKYDIEYHKVSVLGEVIWRFPKEVIEEAYQRL